MKLLLIEDENNLAKDISTYLSSSNIHCEWVNTLNLALEKISAYEYDCILLDLTLPDGNGITILKELKKQQKNEGIIIISAKDTLESRLEGLQLGADDYLTKPFHIAELLARVHAVIRRKQFAGNNRLIINELEIDLLAKTLKVNQKNIDLTKKEFDLLLYLIGNKNRVLPKSSLAEHLSGDMADMLDNHDFVYAHIKNLKKKLSQAGAKDYIKTIYGTGYKWEV
nr:response regulator transcription factor [Rhodoflexus caldus]